VNLVVQPATSLSGEIELPPSKLYTQIACALAILAEGKSTIESPLRVKDTNVMFKAAEVMGATVKRTQERLSVWGVGNNMKPAQNAIDAKNSGTAAGLLTSIATLALTPTVINGDVQLRSRPMPALLQVLRRMGADVHSTKPDDSLPFVVFGGGLSGGKVKLSEAEMRYLPAVLLPAPYAKKNVEFSVPPGWRKLQLEPTLALMKTAHAKITENRGIISVRNHPYHAFNYKVEREVVGAAPFIVAAGLLDSRLRVRGMKEISFRDLNFLKALKSFGLKLCTSGKLIEVEGKYRLRGTKLDLSWAPELLPLMAVLSCAASGKTLIRNAEEARTMKSDRISAIAQELRRMQARVLEQSDGLVIQGPAKLKGCEVDGHGDYAVVSALAVAGLLAEGKTVIKNGADALSVSYSRFVSTFQSLGAEMSYSS
jgi:3-phosphoshikimate 1-carboxyvinyltransferase